MALGGPPRIWGKQAWKHRGDPAATKNVREIYTPHGKIYLRKLPQRLDAQEFRSAALNSTFSETLNGPLAEIVVRNWGVLIAIVGAMLIYGVFDRPSRRRRSKQHS